MGTFYERADRGLIWGHFTQFELSHWKWRRAAEELSKVSPNKKVWALLGPHRGDNNQVLALAEALGLPFEEKPLSYNGLRRVPPGLLGATFASVDAGSRAVLEGEPPDLTISTGLRSVPVVRELKRRSGGRTRTVHLGYPRISPGHFDLVVP